MDCSMPSISVLHYLPEFAYTRAHWASDAIQPFHPLLSPSPPALNLPSISSLHQVAKVLKFQLQYQSFQWIFRVDFLSDWLVWSPWCSRDSQESSPTPQFKSINSSVLSLPYGPTFTLVHSWTYLLGEQNSTHYQGRLHLGRNSPFSDPPKSSLYFDLLNFLLWPLKPNPTSCL